MTVVNLWAGGVDHQSARFKAKASSGTSSVDLLIGTSPDLLDAPVFGTQVPDAQDMVSFVIAGLSTDTRYYYALDEDDTFDPNVDPIGTFRTFPVAAGNPASFTFAVGGCAGAGPPDFPGSGAELDSVHVSNHPVFDEIAQRGIQENWLFFAHTGDFHYYNIGTDKTASLTTYRRAIDDVLLQQNQQSLYASMPVVYEWDDHDFDGNNSDGTYVDKAMPQQVYREKVPSYSLPDDDAIYHSFHVGRVLFIVSDNRSDRSPNIDPDGPSKTMLGAAQKAWMGNLLEASNAEALVWIHQQAWLSGGGIWASFQTEAAELVQMFTDTGFVDRMMVVTGDSHYFAIDDGTNTPGGMPMMVANHLDSSPGGSSFSFSEGMVINGKGQYGTVEITDNVDYFDVVFRGWSFGGTLIKQFSFTIGDAPEPGPEPEPTPTPVLVPTVGVAKPRTEVTWLGCNLTTGKIIAEIPGARGQVSRALGAYTSPRVRIPIPRAGPESKPSLPLLLAATKPTRTMIVPVVNDVPMAAFIPLIRRGGTGGELELALVSIEGYLARRFVRDHEWQDQDEASVIAAGLIDDAGDIPDVGSGIGLMIDAPATGTTRDRTYEASDHATVYERLRQLMGVRNGPEWTIDFDWTDSGQTAISKIFRVRKRIGVAASDPEAVFETNAPSEFSSQGSSNARYTLSEDHTDGRFANYMVAYTVGEGEDQPESEPAIDQAALDAGAPIWERHWMPSSSITEVDTLNEHAISDLSRLQNGLDIWTIESRWNRYPRYGVDWELGDDVGWRLTGHRHPRPEGEPSSPGVVDQGRVIGFELDMQTGIMRPHLLRPGAEVITE